MADNPANVQPQLGRIVYAGSDSPIHSGPIFKKRPNHIVQTRPGSDLDGLVRFWPNAFGPEASRCARIIGPGSGKTQPIYYQFPTLRLGCVLPQTARIMCKTSPGPIWLIVSGFGQTGPLLANASEPMRIERFRHIYWGTDSDSLS